MSRPVLLIAGGSRGIGAATARLAGARGYDVAVNYNSNANAAASVVAAVKASGGKAVAIQGDMAREDEIERVFEAAPRRSGRSRISCTAPASSGKSSRLDAVEAAALREVLDVNTYGALLFLRAGIRRMSTKHGGKGGSIVLLSSMAADHRRRRRICLVCGGQRRHQYHDHSASAREVAKEGIRDQRGVARNDRHRYPEPGRLERLRPIAADGPAGDGGRSRRSHPVPALGCGLLHYRRHFAGLRRQR